MNGQAKRAKELRHDSRRSFYLVCNVIIILKKRYKPIKNILIIFAFALMSFSAMAEHHGAAKAEVRDAANAFNAAFAAGEVEDYFSYYTDDATLFFFGARQDVSAYHEEWTELVAAGYTIEKYDLSDLRVQVMPSGDAAVSTYFIDFRTRDADAAVAEGKAFETDVWQKVDGKWKVVSLHYTEIPPQE